MVFKNKLFLFIFVFFLFLIGNKCYAGSYSYDLHEYVNKQYYAIYEGFDNNIYFVTNQSSNNLNVNFKITFYNNHLISSLNNSSSRLGDVNLYILENGNVNFIDKLNFQKVNDIYLDKFLVKSVIYCNNDIFYCDTSNLLKASTPVDLSNVKVGDSDFFLEGVFPLEKKYYDVNEDDNIIFKYNTFYLRTNFFNWSNRLRYQLCVSRDGINYNILDSCTKVSFYDSVSQSYKFALTFCPPDYGTYYFKIYDNTDNTYSNTVTFNFTNNVLIPDLSNQDFEMISPFLNLLIKDNKFYVTTQWLNYDDYKNYKLYYKFNYEMEYFQNTNSNIVFSDYYNNLFRFEFEVNKRGDYYFTFFDSINNKYSDFTKFFVDFFITGNENDVIFDDDIPILNLTLDRSKSNLEQAVYKSQIFYDFDFLYDIYFYNTSTSTYEIFLDFDVVVNDDNSFYYLLYFNEDGYFDFCLGSYFGNTLVLGDLTFLEVNYFSKFSEYDIMLNKYITLFKDSFGFFVYPFEFMIDLLNRFMNIQFNEPIIYIPDIYVPGTDYILINSTSLNFNDLINNNSTFKTLHNLILICSDSFIIFGLIFLIYKKFKEVTY